MSEQGDLIPGELGTVTTDIAAALRAGQALAPLRPIEDDKRFSVIVPEGSEHKVIDPDHAPRRKRGTVKVDTAAAFELYVDRHRIEDRTTVWVPGDAESNLLTAPRIEAVIDDHRHNSDGGDPEYGNAGFGFAPRAPAAAPDGGLEALDRSRQDAGHPGGVRAAHRGRPGRDRRARRRDDARDRADVPGRL